MAVAGLRSRAVWRSVSHALAGPALLVGLAVLLLFGPIHWPCPMMTLLHVPCPTCGMTRATRALLRGDLAAATRWHPLWFVVLPAIALATVAEVVGYVRTQRWGAALTTPWLARVGSVVVALLIAVWIARFFGAFGGPVPR